MNILRQGFPQFTVRNVILIFQQGVLQVFRRKLVGALASALAVTGLIAPVASAYTERVVPPEERDSYVAEFQYEADNPPVVDGVGGMTDAEIAEVQDKIRQAEASGPPQDEIVPGQMWSDKVGVPEGYDKAQADRSEVAIAREQSQPQARGFQSTANRCRSFWLIPYQVCGAILDRYEQLGGEASWLLLPIEHQSINPDGQGYRQRFAGGSIYWHPDTGAHAVSPMTMDLWQRHGWETGWLGYPVSGEVPVEGSSTIDGETSGWVQRFQGGRVYRTPVLEGFQVASINGLILDKWLDLGGPDSDLGFPISDEAKTSDEVGRFSTFQYGSMYWHPNTGAHQISGTAYEIWAQSGYETGRYGYPEGEASIDSSGHWVQEFEGGEIDVTHEINTAGTTNIGGKEINNLLIAMLTRQGLSLESFDIASYLEENNAQSGIQSLEKAATVSAVAAESGVPVPGRYNYDPNAGNLRDYCSSSPDGILIGARFADFRGACAKHDICYFDNQYGVNTSRGYALCNNQFHDDLLTVCNTTYPEFYNLGDRQRCMVVASSYYEIVVAAHPSHWPGQWQSMWT